MLNGKNVLLGVTASIAAYKAANLVRLLKKSGANVQVIQTPKSLEFITPLTLSTLSENPVSTKMVNDEDKTWNNHVKLGLWADIMIIAPASAKTLSKMVNGINGLCPYVDYFTGDIWIPIKSTFRTNR